MDVQIPLYRAEKINNGENIEGFFSDYTDGDTMEYIALIENDISTFRIDPSTLAIHFPDMIDSEGNKIFASLSESGKGGDICYHPTVSNEDLNGVVAYNRGRFSINNGLTPKWSRLVVAGIKK